MARSDRRKKAVTAKRERRANRLESSGRSKYAQRQRGSYKAVHHLHTVPVAACPLCNPSGSDRYVS